MPVQLAQPSDCRDRLLHAVDDEAGEPVLQHLRHRAAAEGDDRRAAGHGLDHGYAEGLGPVDREKKCHRVPERPLLGGVVDLAHELHQRVVEQRCYLLLEIELVHPIDLGEDAQGHALRAWRSRSRGLAASLARPGRGRRDSHPSAPARTGADRAAVRDGPCQASGPAASAGAGHRRSRPAACPSNSRNSGCRSGRSSRPCSVVTVQWAWCAEQRKMQVVGVEVQHVEALGLPPYRIELQHRVRQRVLDRGVEPQGLARAGNQPGQGPRVAAGKERHLMTEPHQGIGQVGHHPLRPAIKPRRYPLDQRRDLGDAHACISLRLLSSLLGGERTPP